MTNDAAEPTSPVPVTIAENVVLGSIDLEGSDKPGTPVEVLDAATGGSGGPMFALVLMAASEGFAAGHITQAPTDSRLDILGNTLRQVHRKEIFSYCVEDGDPYPCRTIRALDITGAGTALPEPDSLIG